MKSKILIALCILFVIIIGINTYGIFAEDIGEGFNPGLIPDKETGKLPQINEKVNMIWGSTVTILQILSVGGIVYAGVRYMFASSDKRANIKSSLLLLVIGMVLTFAASTVAGFIQRSFFDVVN